MKTWLGLLSATFCCCAAMADDAVVDLSKHLGRTPALVVVVCEGTERDLPTIGGLVDGAQEEASLDPEEIGGRDDHRDQGNQRQLTTGLEAA